MSEALFKKARLDALRRHTHSALDELPLKLDMHLLRAPLAKMQFARALLSNKIFD